MKEETDNLDTCKRCGKQLGEDEESCCLQCQIEMEEEGIEPSDEDLEVSEPQDNRKKKILQVIILLVLLGVIIARIPSFMDAMEREQPIRMGTYATDAIADKCISNLWTFSRMLQDGRATGQDLVCPASGDPYVVIEDETEIKVYCPNPGKHGLRELTVSKNFPRPEVREQ